jgi:hypothetical protein
LLNGEVHAKPLSHASDGAAKATWSWHDVAAESCWRWCRGDDFGRGAMSLPSHVGDDTAKAMVLSRRHGRGAMSMHMLK